jgi:hypothetical protein
MKMLLAACLLLVAAAAAAQTVYRYRGPGGETLYSNTPVPGAELIESYLYRSLEPASPRRDTSKSDAAGEARIRLQLSNLEAAWRDTQVTGKTLADAEARLAAGITPEEAEVLARGGPPAPVEPGPGPETPPVEPPVKPPPPTWRPNAAPPPAPAAPAAALPPQGPAAPSAGGPMPSAAPSEGGPAFVAPPAAGGPMAERRGGGMRPEYRARMAALEADVATARLRNQEAWSRYNQLR